IRDVTNRTNLVWYQYYGGTNWLDKKWFPNGLYTKYEYDDAGQILHLTNYDPNNPYGPYDPNVDKVFSRFDYTYDLAGNRLTMNTLEGLHQYAYDDRGQLTEVNYPDGRHVEYKYDSAGNRIQVIDNNSVTSYVTNNLNEYTSVDGYACTYDLNGNLTQRITAEGTFEYQYDAVDRLIAVSGPNQVIEYAYDPLGQRIRRTSNGVVNNFIVEPMGLGNVVAEHDANGVVIAYYDYGYGLLSRTEDFNSIAYYSFDALGSTSELIDQTGNILNSYTYDPFGISLGQSETLPNPFQYVGEYGVMNEGDGLFFMRARYYQADIGRFISPDPLYYPVGDLNVYRYSMNNPLTYVDPEGEGLLALVSALIYGVHLLATNPQLVTEVVCSIYSIKTGEITGQPSLPGLILETMYEAARWVWEKGQDLLDEIRKRISDTTTITGEDIFVAPYRSGGSGANMSGGICPTFIQSPLKKAIADSQTVEGGANGKQLVGKILVPINDCLLRSDIPIYGIAGGKQFKKYRVEYSGGYNPTKWHLIEESNEPDLNPPDFKDITWMQGDLDLRGNLATWNVGLKNWSHLPWHPPEDPTDLNGVYTIRLVVEGKDGKTIEDRVTCEVGRAIAQCLPGIAISPDKRVVMRFPEQALTHPFRVYTILPLSGVGEKIPVPPIGFKLIGSAYRIREPGDKFAKDVTLEFNTTTTEIGKSIPNQIGICRYDIIKKKWIWLETSRNEESTVFRTILTELPKHKAIYALAFDPSTDRSTIAEPDAPSPIPAKPIEPGVLVSCTFEDDFGTFKPRDRFVGAKLVRDDKSTADGTYCLKLVNENHGGNLSCTVLDKSFDVTEYPDMHFNYRIGRGVKIDFLLKVNGRWYRLRFTGDEIEYRYRDVNIDHIGSIPEVVADNKWRSAVIDLRALLRQKTRHTRIDEIMLADWQVGGFMKLDYGRNRRDASLCIDNFNIFARPAAGRKPVLLVDNFD
ncbi:MAG: RHS repeat domain-containing protein, partial [Planctomycetota bacterium]